jgi:hypothetical protein
MQSALLPEWLDEYVGEDNPVLETFIAMLHLACGIITWHAAGLLQ